MSHDNDIETREIVVFDFDGTITTKDTFALFLRYYAGTFKWLLNIITLLPVFAGYALKLISRDSVKTHVVRKFFKGQSVDAVDLKAKNFAEDVIPGLIRPQAQIALDKAKKDPESLYICSASILPYLDHWGKSQNIHNILATELEEVNGLLTGRINGWNIWGPGKVRRILAEFSPYSVKIMEAYGDSRGDKEMLHAAEVSFWRPFRLIAHE